MHTVLVVEDNREVRSRICAAISDDPELQLCGEAGSVSAARKFLKRGVPSIVLVDLDLPDGSGDSIISWLRDNAPSVESLVLSVFGDERHVVTAIESGASGYLLKCDAVEDICRNIKLVLEHQSPISPAVARHILKRTRVDAQRSGTEMEQSGGARESSTASQPNLTPTELDVLRFIAQGFTAPEIAEKTGKSPATVPVHIRNIYKKLSVHGRGEAVFQAMQMGIIGSGQH
jgi:DNA-binding NarL/FixJ family response regulator